MSSSATEVCDGESLAIILGLYWVVYMVINAVVFAGAMYALQQCLEKKNTPGGAGKARARSRPSYNDSRASSQIGLIPKG
ncbi:unnamed protein product [Adineta steineri]|uniref:Uncharacterized protein n=1 Tax=Adineta steineri TaxID=433720 RepID=A0A815SF55_9BILA|nr:unnamed protein product [Adineta steineri]CAF1347609.1 unnamed protein product [Adineta steineri]CAF1491435.1 unnamed protein product [Adineta steineri]CAF1525415.1 unnamed protein product [Adineta steineri]CAF1651639.1 unnamed protein product [Adineta steineri]